MGFVLPMFSAISGALGSVFGGGAAAATAAAAAGDFVGAGIAAGAGAAGATGAAAGAGMSLGSALSIGATGLSALGAVAQGVAANKAAKFNAAEMERQGQQAQMQAAAKATELASRTRQRMAAVRAGTQQNGLDLTGSALDVLDTVQTQGALDEITALYDGTERAKALRQSAAIERAKGGNSLLSGFLGGAGSILTGASRMYQGA